MLVNENAKTKMSDDEFNREYVKLTTQYERLFDRIAAIQKEKDDKEYRAKRISLFIRLLAELEDWLEFDSVLFTAFVERVIVNGTKKDIRLTYVMGARMNMGWMDGIWGKPWWDVLFATEELAPEWASVYPSVFDYLTLFYHPKAAFRHGFAI